MEQMPSNTPVMESKPGPAGWLPVWIKALTKPSEQTFVEITEHPDATAKTAFIWVFVAGLISGLAQAILQLVYAATGTSPQLPIPGLEQYAPSGGGDVGTTGITIVALLCVTPFLSIIFFAIGTAIVQWIAKLFGGLGSFDKLAYALAAITVPFTLVSAVLTLLTAIPFVGACTGLLSLGLTLYIIVLEVMAVKGVNRLGWGQATGSVILPGCVIFIFCACVVFGGLMILGPMIGQTFEGINNFAP